MKNNFRILTFTDIQIRYHRKDEHIFKGCQYPIWVHFGLLKYRIALIINTPMYIYISNLYLINKNL